MIEVLLLGRQRLSVLVSVPYVYQGEGGLRQKGEQVMWLVVDVAESCRWV